MSKDDPKNQAEWIRFLKRRGWKQHSGGRHGVVMKKDGRTVPLPDHRRADYGKGLNHQVKKQAGFDETSDEDE